VNDRLMSVARTPGVPQSPFVLVKDATYAYDAAGNVTRKTEPDIGGTEQVTTFVWDAEGRMAGATPKFIITPQAPQPEPITYVYDAEGQLVKEVRGAAVGQVPPPGNVTLYLADKNRPFSQILEERDGSGAIKTSYLFGDTLIKQVKAGTVSYVHSDHLSTQFLTDGTGALQTRYAYSPYGETTNASQAGSSTPATITTAHQFAGERFNSDLTLYYNRARWMDARVGRLNSVDSHLGFPVIPATLNKYSYAVGNPMFFTDPSGMESLGDIGTAGNIQGGLSSSALPNVSRKALDFARKAKIFDINDYATWPLHFYIYVERTGSRSGIRYDVGNAVGWGGMSRVNPLGVIEGGFVASSPVNNRQGITGIGKKVVSHSFGQWLIWHVTVIGTEQTSCAVSVAYSLTPGLGTNCLSWTIWATAKALAISRLPL